VGIVPHRAVLPADGPSSEGAEVQYFGNSLQPLAIYLPDAVPDRVPMTVEPARTATSLPKLYLLLSGEDEPELDQARRSGEDRISSRHHRPDHRHIDLDEGGGHGGEGNSGGVPAPVPLPGSLPLLGTLMALCAAGAGLLRRTVA
jgi:hypothetical protein